MPLDHLTLVVPGVVGLPEISPRRYAAKLSARALERWLARADAGPGGVGGLDDLLLALFGVRAHGMDPPLAAVTAAVDLGRECPGSWLRADPVHLRADRDTLVLEGGETLALSREEASRLVAELAQVFLPRGWRLHLGAAQRWYVQLPDAPAVRTHPPSRAVGKDVRPYLPEGDQAPLWHALMNEAQMQLSLSPVNEERLAKGKPAVNSVWFWGGGGAPKVLSPCDVLWCDHVVGVGLAAIAGADRRGVPGGADTWLQEAGPGKHVIVLESAEAALRALDARGWQTALQHLDAQWISPLLTALGRARLGAVTLVTGAGTNYTVTPAAARRWWRRKRLAQFLANGSDDPMA